MSCALHERLPRGLAFEPPGAARNHPLRQRGDRAVLDGRRPLLPACSTRGQPENESEHEARTARRHRAIPRNGVHQRTEQCAAACARRLLERFHDRCCRGDHVRRQAVINARRRGCGPPRQRRFAAQHGHRRRVAQRRAWRARLTIQLDPQPRVSFKPRRRKESVEQLRGALLAQHRHARRAQQDVQHVGGEAVGRKRELRRRRCARAEAHSAAAVVSQQRNVIVGKQGRHGGRRRCGEERLHGHNSFQPPRVASTQLLTTQPREERRGVGVLLAARAACEVRELEELHERGNGRRVGRCAVAGDPPREL